MTTQEIKDLVAAKIAGQGNQIDLGNAGAEMRLHLFYSMKP